MKKGFYVVALLWCCTGCQSGENPNLSKNRWKEIVRRTEQEQSLSTPFISRETITYPWASVSSSVRPITRAFFRCKGRWDHPYRKEVIDGEEIYLQDCGGFEQHSLPLRDGKEFIYPILLALLNYIQEKTGQEVEIVAGHRCPEHQRYVDASPQGQIAKHMVGAEVAFYVRGYEESPEEIISLLEDYYHDSPFQRYEKSDTNVRTKPWYNKEIFLKIFQADEGRNPDVAFSHPYLSMQVRWDPETGKRVVYSWDEAYRNYYRW